MLKEFKIFLRRFPVLYRSLKKLRGIEPPKYFLDAPPELKVEKDLDFLLLELPPRYMPMMPNGLGYVHRILERSGVRFQTLDTSIVLYHKYHQRRMRSGAGNGENAAIIDPWENTSSSLWTDNAFLDKIFEDFGDLFRGIVDSPPRAIGISLNGFNRQLAKKFIAELRGKIPDTAFVVGGYDCVYAHVGPHLFQDFDYMIIGEAETSLGPLVKALAQGQRPGDLPGIFSRYDSLGRVFSPAEPLEDLDSIDFPQYEWIDHAFYQSYDRRHLVPITASRGCNWSKCRFCAECFSFRMRSPESVADEIQWWTEKGLHTFHFNESDVNGDPKNLYNICSLIIERKLNVQLVGQLRISKHNTKEYFDHLYTAGFRHLRFGVDGWSRNTLKLQRKGYTIDKVYQNIKDCHSSGIYTTVNMVIGVPGETDEDVDESIQNISRLKNSIDAVEGVNTLILAAGSEYARNPDKYGIVFRSDKEALYRENPYFIPSDLWYSVDPYIDQAIRLKRMNRIISEIDRNGVNIGSFAKGIIDGLRAQESN